MAGRVEVVRGVKGKARASLVIEHGRLLRLRVRQTDADASLDGVESNLVAHHMACVHCCAIPSERVHIG